jgi:hypothetical protein
VFVSYLFSLIVLIVAFFLLMTFFKVVDWDRMVWGDEDAVVEILLCIWEACSFTDMIGKMSFDKDDLLGMRFVCASSNIRSNVFGIPPMSFHDAKGIALLPFTFIYFSFLIINIDIFMHLYLFNWSV